MNTEFCSLNLEKSKLMLVVISHDAGGAEVLSSYVRQRGIDCLYVLEGPAREIFERKLGPVETIPIEEAIQLAASILCGTSWQSDLEFRAIKLARSAGKRSVAFLDHWVNYRERFVRLNETCMPDEIWVGDSVAEKLATRIFPNTQIRLVENPYFHEILEELAAFSVQRPSDKASVSVLYVCEPVREHALRQFGDERHWGYVEEEALRYFLANVSALGKSIDRILIRPHPSEPNNKYNWAQQEFDLPIAQGGLRPLLEEIAAADVVVGCESMAMAIGLFADKRVVSCIPPGGKRCALPQSQIESLQSLLEKNTIQ